VEEENNSNIKQESKTGVEIRELKRITVINGINDGGVNLAATSKIRKVGKAPF